jgi:hypothetical protein
MFIVLIDPKDQQLRMSVTQTIDVSLLGVHAIGRSLGL